MSDLVVAAETAAIDIDGVPNVISAGHTFAHPDHPVVKAHPTLWRPVEVHYPDPATLPEPEPEPEPGPFDPAAHTVADVNAYLAGAELVERERVLQLEAEGKGRGGILSGPHSDLSGLAE